MKESRVELGTALGESMCSGLNSIFVQSTPRSDFGMQISLCKFLQIRQFSIVENNEAIPKHLLKSNLSVM